MAESAHILSVHKQVESVIVKFINIVGAHLNMFDSDADGDRCYCDVRVEHFGNPYFHISPTAAESCVVQNFDLSWISWSLRHN